MNTALNNSSGEYWQNAANWSEDTIPLASETTVTIPAGVMIQTSHADALAGTLGKDSSGNARGASTTIAGSLTLNESSGETDFDASVTISPGGVLVANNPATQPVAIGLHGGLLVFNGSLEVAGSLGTNSGQLGSGRITCNGTFQIDNGALIYNFNPTMLVASDCVLNAGSTLVVTYGIRQYANLPPSQFTQIIASPWTDVSVTGMLGGIPVKTTDYQGNLCDLNSGLTYPLIAFVYRNGTLWNGLINITNYGTGIYSIDLSLADGIWQLGDHGQIDIYWQVANGNPATVGGGNPEWFLASYFFLVDRLEYETYGLAMQIAAATGPPVNITTENTIIQSNS